MHIGLDKTTIIVAQYTPFYQPVIVILIHAIFPPSNHQIIAAKLLRMH